MDKKIVLITGCSSGFGYLSAIQLAEKEYRVIATMRDLSKRVDLDNKIKTGNLPINVCRIDVTDLDSIKRCIKDIDREYGRLDVLVNNAGYGIGGFFEDLSDREFREQMETNFFGVLNMVRETLPLLRKSDDARIINISSAAGLTTTPGMGAYNASKWALEAFSESLRQELALHGMKVLLIEPGPYPTKVLTTNTRFAEKANDPNSPNYKFTQQLYVKYKQNNATLKSDPMEIARLIEKLISEKNPSFRNVHGPGAKLRAYMHRFLPWSFNEWVIRRVIFGKV
ncbi:MAG: SDR family NAD(P)-dependent oxidoreductase [Candidatus Marinimicrobia bacterium]|nr:SDR family NAD(P)-dependent oxidoreductase [Candidatus Neomarinimicrobiota bacterium]